MVSDKCYKFSELPQVIQTLISRFVGRRISSSELSIKFKLRDTFVMDISVYRKGKHLKNLIIQEGGEVFYRILYFLEEEKNGNKSKSKKKNK